MLFTFKSIFACNAYQCKSCCKCKSYRFEAANQPKAFQTHSQRQLLVVRTNFDANYINRRGRAALGWFSFHCGSAVCATFKSAERVPRARASRFLFSSQSRTVAARLFSFYCSKYKNSACNRAAINNFERCNFSAWCAAHLNASRVTEICVC
jgi:hypothetical protein